VGQDRSYSRVAKRDSADERGYAFLFSKDKKKKKENL
jgi:hypothetical protein